MKKFIIFANNNNCADFFITNDGENGGLLDFAYSFNQQKDSFRVIDSLNFEDAENCVDETIYNVYQKVLKKQGNVFLGKLQFHLLWTFAQYPWIDSPTTKNSI